jgi:TrmH family RNA methyltransferase
MEIITSRSNPRIKQVRALRQRKARQEGELFLVEGIRPVGEAYEAGATLETIYYAPERLRSPYAQALIQQVSERGIECFAVSSEVFESIADKENPQGILAVVHQPKLELDSLSPENFKWGVALVDPQDPGNTGTILRTIDAVGASGLLLLSGREDTSGLVDAYHPGAVRASMGTIFWHPVVKTPFSEFIQWTTRNQYHIYGSSAHAETELEKIEIFHSPAILLMGSEREGLSDEQSRACEQMIRLPMLGRATSLNLAVATGIILYDMLKRLA